MLYRIFQEESNNVIKHSRAPEIVLQLIEYDDHLNLLLEDNGIGFNPEQVQAGLGMQSIRSRVHFLNGDQDISS